MKQKVLWSLFVITALVFAGSGAATDKEATIEGILVDSKCFLSDKAASGNDHGPMKNCGTLCLRGGTPAGVLTKDKKFFAVIAPSPALADFVGQTVRVRGTLHNGSLLANKVEVNKGGKWEEVKLGAMM